MKELIVDSKVYADLELASEFYELLDPGCGDYLIRSILTDLRALPRFAGIHRKSFGLHGMKATKFPFTIYYRMEKDAVTVVAVLDQRRAPDAIHSELRSR